MVLLTLLYTALGVYVVMGILVFWILTNNIFIWRSKDYEIPFEGTKKGWLPKGIRYWRCDNPNHVGDRWVVLLHSWGRNSARMVERGQIYWDRGYSLILLDAWSHGQSKYKRTTTALWFAEHAHDVVQKEGIPPPIVHGLSFGAIAATVYAANFPVRALVAEALMNNVKDMMFGFLRYMKIPTSLFGWEVILLLKSGFPWEKVNPSNNLPMVKAPIFLIHGENDKMFPVDIHFSRNTLLLKEDDVSWVVKNSPHSKMCRYPGYREKVEEFLTRVEESWLVYERPSE